jgi:hypothetical protein
VALTEIQGVQPKKWQQKKYNLWTFFRTQQEFSMMIKQVSTFAQRLEKFENAKGAEVLTKLIEALQKHL